MSTVEGEKPKKAMSVVVYVPESTLRQPKKMFIELWFDLLASRDVAWQMLIRDISAQYRQSFLGILWAFIPPLATALSFTWMKNAQILNLGETSIPYPLFVTLNMTLWQLFASGLTGSIGASQSAKRTIAKIRVPAEAFLLASLGQVCFNFFIQLGLLIVMFIWFKVKVSWTILLAPVALIHLLMFGTVIGLILGPISSLYNDVSKALSFVMQFWLLITPVLYPLPKQGTWSFLIQLNPVTPLIVTCRELITGEAMSNVTGFWLVSALAMIGLVIGLIFFRISMPFIVERSSS